MTTTMRSKHFIVGFEKYKSEIFFTIIFLIQFALFRLFIGSKQQLSIYIILLAAMPMVLLKPKPLNLVAFGLAFSFSFVRPVEYILVCESICLLMLLRESLEIRYKILTIISWSITAVLNFNHKVQYQFKAQLISILTCIVFYRLAMFLFREKDKKSSYKYFLFFTFFLVHFKLILEHSYHQNISITLFSIITLVAYGCNLYQENVSKVLLKTLCFGIVSLLDFKLRYISLIMIMILIMGDFNLFEGTLTFSCKKEKVMSSLNAFIIFLALNNFVRLNITENLVELVFVLILMQQIFFRSIIQKIEFTYLSILIFVFSFLVYKI